MVSGKRRLRIARVTESGGSEELRRQRVLPLGREQVHDRVGLCRVQRQARAATQTKAPLRKLLAVRAESIRSGEPIRAGQSVIGFQRQGVAVAAP